MSAAPSRGLDFRDVVRLAGLDPGSFKALRHQGYGPHALTPWALWEAEPASFEFFQRIQGSGERIGDARNIASFVLAPDQATVFVGIWQVLGLSRADPGTVDPLSKTDVGGYHLYDLRRTEYLSDYIGRLVINWPKSRRWDRRLDRADFPIVEIRAAPATSPFPGYLRFRSRLADLYRLPPAWREVLTVARGIYLLVDELDGSQYVGSATGSGGFFGRWQSYAADGHGGNLLLRQRARRDYSVSVLEVVGSGLSDEQVELRESEWKRKLGSRAHGLNAN